MAHCSNGKHSFRGNVLKSTAREELASKAADDIRIAIFQILRSKANK